MVVLGRIGTLLGPVLRAVAIVLIKSLLSTYVARWPLVIGLIFIVVLLFAWDGLLGAMRRISARLCTEPPKSLGPAIVTDDGIPPVQSAIAGEEERVIARG